MSLQYFKKQIDRAGKMLANKNIQHETFLILNDWRAAHIVPLNTIASKDIKRRVSHYRNKFRCL